MIIDQQILTLGSTIAKARQHLETHPHSILFLVSDGKNGGYSFLDPSNKTDRQQLLCNNSLNIRATITPACTLKDLAGDSINKLHTELSNAFTPNGKTYIAFDLGDFITRTIGQDDAEA